MIDNINETLNEIQQDLINIKVIKQEGDLKVDDDATTDAVLSLYNALNDLKSANLIEFNKCGPVKTVSIEMVGGMFFTNDFGYLVLDTEAEADVNDLVGKELGMESGFEVLGLVNIEHDYDGCQYFSDTTYDDNQLINDHITIEFKVEIK